MKIASMLLSLFLLLAFASQMINAQTDNTPAALRQMAVDYYH